MLTTENHVVKNEVHNGWSVRKWLILFENNTWIYLRAEMKYIPGDFFLCVYMLVLINFLSVKGRWCDFSGASS